jgi:hypothetical protein
LTEEDRRNLVLLRMKEVGQTTSGQELQREDVMKGVKDWKVYAYAIAQFVGLGMLYSFSVFLPTIINGLGGGWSRQVVQALTIPVYVCGFLTYVVSAYFSDKTQNRGLYCIGGLCVSMIGYIFLIANKVCSFHSSNLPNHTDRYTGTWSQLHWLFYCRPRPVGIYRHRLLLDRRQQPAIRKASLCQRHADYHW